MIPWLEADTPFPDVSEALSEDDEAPGLLAAGGDLSPARLLDAYRQGIFPWYSDGQPILWWSTDPRMVLPTDQLIISHSLKKGLRKVQTSMRTDQRLQIHFDRDFEAVMRACAGPRTSQRGTWISEEIIEAYLRLHDTGYAHSSELWLDDVLIGGLYGVCIGKMFYGESMFSHVTDASKMALAFLVHFLNKQGVKLIDCQQATNHLASLGGIIMPRNHFIQHIHQTIDHPPILNWQPDIDLI